MVQFLQINLHHSKVASAALLTKDKGKTRTCILTKTHFNAFLIPQFSEGDLTTVRLELNEHTHHTIASFYLAQEHEGPLPNTTTQQFIRTHSSKELILGGDANSYHTMGK